MANDMTEDDREKLLQLGIVSNELFILRDELDQKRRLQRRLALDLIQREVISQARASRIMEVQRQTISNWLQADFEGRGKDES